MMFRFTLSHAVLGSQIISEPDGWKGAKIKLERHKDFFSLIEYYEGAANGAFIFYGDNGTENGGIDFIRQVESTYGFDAELNILIEYSEDDMTYSTLFTGQLDISQKTEMPDNRMQLPVIRNDFWATFINRFDTPVDVTKNTDIDGNEVAPASPITVNLTPQAVRQNYDATSSGPGFTEFPVNVIPSGRYYQVSFDQRELEEIKDVFVLPQIDNTELPAPIFEPEYAGVYSFEIQTVAHDYSPAYNFSPGEDLSDYIQFYININGVETAFTVGDLFQSGFNIDGGRVYTLNLANQVLEAGSLVRVYGKTIAPLTVGGGSYDGQIRWNGPVSGNLDINGGGVINTTIECFCRITADTTYPETQAPGFLIHDLIHAVLVRNGLGSNPFYSEFLGGLNTNARSYDEDGCGWMYAVLKGVHIRGYNLTEDENSPTERYTLQQKGFFISMKQIWEGINPILNLGLGYEEINGTEVIRIEEKGHFIGDTPPVNFSNVRDITSEYDPEFIFKTIKTGYKKWQSEDISGNDDPQTKHTYALPFKKVGGDLNLESDFIAAGIAIETTRRTNIIKSADYKFDNDNFIISLNTDDVSPDTYAPELDENFASVTNLLNADSRYNLILTPLRNLLRWANYIGGCLQKYVTSDPVYKFQSGEGNYDMETDANLGTCSRAVIGDSLAESDSIVLGSPGNYNTAIGYFFLPMIYNINIPMDKDDFDLIDRKQPLGISQSDVVFADFHIKELTYDIVRGTANIKAWPKLFFDITVPEQEIPESPCAENEEEGFDDDYQAILDYATGLDIPLPSAEQQILQNQFILDLKAAGIWTNLDILYVFATHDQDFARINWKNPSAFDMQHGTFGPDFTENVGFLGNGTNQFMHAGWAPGTNGVKFTQEDCSAFCYLNNTIAAEAGKSAFGGMGAAGAGRTELQPNNASNLHWYTVNSASLSATGSSVNSEGLFHIQRTSAARLFKNGSQVGSDSVFISSPPTTQEFYLFALNNNGTAQQFSAVEMSLFGAGASLSGKENALKNAWNNYFSSL